MIDGAITRSVHLFTNAESSLWLAPAAIPADVERFGIPLFPLPQGEDQGEGVYALVRNAILTVEPAFII